MTNKIEEIEYLARKNATEFYRDICNLRNENLLYAVENNWKQWEEDIIPQK